MNCYNSELPIGPQGPQGPPGQQGNPGNNGQTGAQGPRGIDGINNFSTLKEAFTQPTFVDDPTKAFTIKLENAIWVSIGSPIYIGYGTSVPVAGGYYMVLNKYMNGDSQAVSVYRLSWTLPNTIFVTPGNPVFLGSAVSTAGTKGANGTNGTSGTDTFTNTIQAFSQPAVGDDFQISVANNTWMSSGQLLFIETGGFYEVVSFIAPNLVTVKRLDWTVPYTTFKAEGEAVLSFQNVSSSGPKGADGTTSELAYIEESQWGSFGGSTPGLNAFKTSIAVPGFSLTEDSDELECQTVFRLIGNIPSTAYDFYIKVGTAQTTADSTAIAFTVPITSSLDSGDSFYININYKIQKTGSDLYRSKGECFVSNFRVTPVLPAVLFSQTIGQSFLCVSTRNISLISSNWEDQQFVSVIVNDGTPAKISVVHHEVKVVKKKV